VALRAARQSRFGSITSDASAWIDRGLERRGRRRSLNDKLERAGLELRPGEYVLLVACVAFSVAAVCWLLSGPLLGLLAAAAVPLAATTWVRIRGDKRVESFAGQLGDTLQLLSGGMRAGYGLLQAVDSVAREAPDPTATEFRRAMTEVQLGRDLTDALEAMAARVGNDDFEWVVRAITIHREVGGDLAEVLDNVAETIRDRQRSIRQIRALSAEGRMSAYTLIALPFIMALVLSVLNPSYMDELWSSGIGLVMLAFGGVLLFAGFLWMRAIIRPKF
jgi:tight adherence protein B